MRNIKLFAILLLTFFACTVRGQVTVTLYDVQVNGVSVGSCGTIPFGYNSNVTVSYRWKLTKPSNYTLGTNAKVTISRRYATGDPTTYVDSFLVPDCCWNNGDTEFSFNGPHLAFLGAGGIAYSGSTFFAQYTDTQNNVTSCAYQMTKNKIPTFQISPAAVNIPCGSTSTYTFTLAKTNDATGTYSYRWNVGTGWKLTDGTPVTGEIITTTNSISLIPNGLALPSSVNVTAFVPNVIDFSGHISSVNQTLIAETATISGPHTFCASADYTVTGLNPGARVTAFHLNNTTSADYAPGTLRNPITLDVVNGGVNWVSATITNSCGQSYDTPDYPIYAGAPVAFNLIRASNESCDIKYHKIPFQIYNYTPLLNYNFQLVGSIPGAQISMQTYNNNPQWVVKVPKAYTGGLLVSMTASNMCGTYTAWYDDEVLANCSILPQDKMAPVESVEIAHAFKAYPNPSSDVINISLVEKDYATGKNAEAEIFDLLGQSKGVVKLDKNQAVINVSDFKKGIYILKIKGDDIHETHRIVIE